MLVRDFKPEDLLAYLGWEVSCFIAREDKAVLGVLSEIHPRVPASGRSTTLVLSQAVEFCWTHRNDPGMYVGTMSITESFSSYTTVWRTDEELALSTSCEVMKIVTVLHPALHARATWPVELWVYEPARIVKVPTFDGAARPLDVRLHTRAGVRLASEGEQPDLVLRPRDRGLLVEVRERALTIHGEGPNASTLLSIGTRFRVDDLDMVVALGESAVSRACRSPHVMRLGWCPMGAVDARPVVRLG